MIYDFGTSCVPEVVGFIIYLKIIGSEGIF